MFKRVGKSLLKAWPLTVAVVFIAGVAIASIPDSGGVIHGCYRTTTGALRVINTGTGQTCVAGEVALNWSQIGPRGPMGARGSPGPRGPQGSPGPQGLPGEGTSAYFTSGLADPAVDLRRPPGGENTLVANLILPAGKFLVNGTVVVAASDIPPASAASVNCSLVGGRVLVGGSTDNSIEGGGGIIIGLNGEPAGTNMIPLIAAGVLTGPGRVSIFCSAATVNVEVPADQVIARVRAAGLSATKVSVLEVQGT